MDYVGFKPVCLARFQSAASASVGACTVSTASCDGGWDLRSSQILGARTLLGAPEAPGAPGLLLGTRMLLSYFVYWMHLDAPVKTLL